MRRLAAAAVAAAIVLSLPATALADQPTTTPAVNCVTVNKDGSFSALFGYTNTGATETLVKGTAENFITPSNLEGPEPSTFTAGTTPGAFALAVPAGGTATWTLHGHRQAVATSSSTACNPPVSMPQQGNGFGASLALLAAAAWGTWMMLRSPRVHAGRLVRR